MSDETVVRMLHLLPADVRDEYIAWWNSEEAYDTGRLVRSFPEPLRGLAQDLAIEAWCAGRNHGIDVSG